MNRAKIQSTTLLREITEKLRACASTSDGIATPAVILWTDPKEHFRSLIPTLRSSIPELIIYGDYDPDARTGPAIWLRCMIDHTLSFPELPEGTVPIAYLPGVSRQQLRAGEDCPDSLKPLVELMYRGRLWLQKNGHDWTALAVVTSSQCLGLEIQGDQETMQAMLRALPEFALKAISSFEGKRLTATDFDKMLTPDVQRDLLLWMHDSKNTRERLSAEGRWNAFRNQCKDVFSFDPETDGETTAGEQLGKGDGNWAKLWDRFEEAPVNYPGIVNLLRRSKPSVLIFDESRWPGENDNAENAVRSALESITDFAHGEACEKVIELENNNAKRRSWVWNRLGRSPLAQILSPLSELAKYARTVIGGQTPDDIARVYIENGWRADRASWQAIAMAGGPDEDLVRQVVQVLLKPWLDGCARAFQETVRAFPLPDHSNIQSIEISKGGCILFADGLRYDLGEVLRDRLESLGCRIQLDYRWAALPTVTATAKPAVTPVAPSIIGEELPDDFAPLMKDSRKQANAKILRDKITSIGYQVLEGGVSDLPGSETAQGWSEEGKIDKRGHQLQDDLPRMLNEELDRLTDRIITLLDCGWSKVRVVTDHGWLYLPLGLPKVELPKHLTESKWARCASIAGHSQVDVPTTPWHWNSVQHFATCPGIACFSASNCYAHGGLSIQECLIPDILVERTEMKQDRASIESVSWRGMRCSILSMDYSPGIRADIRLNTPIGESVVVSAKEIDEEGSASLLVKDDAYEIADLVVVLIGGDGNVLAQYRTKVGIDS